MSIDSGDWKAALPQSVDSGDCKSVLPQTTPDTPVSNQIQPYPTPEQVSAALERLTLAVDDWIDPDGDFGTRRECYAYLATLRAHVEAQDAEIETLRATLRVLDDAGATATAFGCTCALTRFHAAAKGEAE